MAQIVWTATSHREKDWPGECRWKLCSPINFTYLIYGSHAGEMSSKRIRGSKEGILSFKKGLTVTVAFCPFSPSRNSRNMLNCRKLSKSWTRKKREAIPCCMQWSLKLWPTASGRGSLHWKLARYISESLWWWYKYVIAPQNHKVPLTPPI